MSDVLSLEEEVRRLNKVISTRRWPTGQKVTDEEWKTLCKNRDAVAMRLADLRLKLDPESE